CPSPGGEICLKAKLEKFSKQGSCRSSWPGNHGSEEKAGKSSRFVFETGRSFADIPHSSRLLCCVFDILMAIRKRIPCRWPSHLQTPGSAPRKTRHRKTSSAACGYPKAPAFCPTLSWMIMPVRPYSMSSNQAKSSARAAELFPRGPPAYSLKCTEIQALSRKSNVVKQNRATPLFSSGTD